MKPDPQNKQAAVRFLELVVAGKIDEAYEKYVSSGGKHHNPYFAAGFPALKQAMEENQAQYPKKRLEVQHALADGDLVAVHSRLTLRPGEAAMIVVHLFRFADGKIAELWDCGQALPADSPNHDGAF